MHIYSDEIPKTKHDIVIGSNRFFELFLDIACKKVKPDQTTKKVSFIKQKITCEERLQSPFKPNIPVFFIPGSSILALHLRQVGLLGSSLVVTEGEDKGKCIWPLNPDPLISRYFRRPHATNFDRFDIKKLRLNPDGSDPDGFKLRPLVYVCVSIPRD